MPSALNIPVVRRLRARLRYSTLSASGAGAQSSQARRTINAKAVAVTMTSRSEQKPSLCADIRNHIFVDRTTAARVAVDRPPGWHAECTQASIERCAITFVQRGDLVGRRVADHDVTSPHRERDDEFL